MHKSIVDRRTQCIQESLSTVFFSAHCAVRRPMTAGFAVHTCTVLVCKYWQGDMGHQGTPARLERKDGQRRASPQGHICMRQPVRDVSDGIDEWPLLEWTLVEKSNVALSGLLWLAGGGALS